MNKNDRNNCIQNKSTQKKMKHKMYIYKPKWSKVQIFDLCSRFAN